MEIKKAIQRNSFLLETIRSIRYFYYKNFFSDEQLIKKRFHKKLGRQVKLNKPVKYNDKLQWLKLYWYDPLATICADKFAVRDFVKDRIGGEYLNELYAVFDSVEQIEIEKLPNSFVLKATHGSGDNIICKDKSQLNWSKTKREMKKWLKKNIYWRTREWVYKDIKPRIICEKYMEETEVRQLRDYKIFCFNGEPKLVEVDFDRFKNHKRNIYDPKWNLLEVDIEYSSDPKKKINKPDSLDEMLRLSEVLSKDFPHVRVDFYNLQDRIIFGELTFFHENGMGIFNPLKFEEEMGNWLELPRTN